MRLLTRSEGGWQFQLSRGEVHALRYLINQFPTTAQAAAKITRTDTDPKAAEREKLLNTSLAEHREELRQQAQHLISGDRLKTRRDQYVWTMGPDGREILLQILNDIRVESWRALGEPENLDALTNPTESEQVHHAHMTLAGHFECELLELEEPQDTASER
jgi:hypothetical protein